MPHCKRTRVGWRVGEKKKKKGIHRASLTQSGGPGVAFQPGLFLFGYLLRGIRELLIHDVGETGSDLPSIPQTVLQPRVKFLEEPLNLLLLLTGFIWRRLEARLLILFVLAVANSRVWTSEMVAALGAEPEFGRVLLARFAVALICLPRAESWLGAQLALDLPDRSALFVGLGRLEHQPLPHRQVHWDFVEIFPVFGILHTL